MYLSDCPHDEARIAMPSIVLVILESFILSCCLNFRQSICTNVRVFRDKIRYLHQYTNLKMNLKRLMIMAAALCLAVGAVSCKKDKDDDSITDMLEKMDATEVDMVRKSFDAPSK